MIKKDYQLKSSQNELKVNNSLSLGSSNLKRADSYRGKYKKIKTEETKKKMFLRRLRSRSTPEIPHNFDPALHSNSAVTERDQTQKKNNEDEIENENKIEPRKKSLSALLGITGNKEVRMRRSNSTRIRVNDVNMKAKRQTLDDSAINKVSESLSMFPATTLFVPGYDFKTGQPVTESQKPVRNHLSPLFQRRNSREKLNDIETSPKSIRKLSSPALTRAILRDASLPLINTSMAIKKSYTPRRGSMPKLTDLPISFHSKGKYGVEQENKIDPFRSFQSYSYLTQKFNTPSEELEVCLSELDLDGRKRILAEKHKAFANRTDLYKSPSDVPYNKVCGKVKNISHGFEDGSLFKQSKFLHFDTRLQRTHSLPSRDSREEYEKCLSLLRNARELELTNNDNVKQNSKESESGYVTPISNDDEEVIHINKNEVHGNSAQTIFNELKPAIIVVQPPPALRSYLLDEKLTNSWPSNEWEREKHDIYSRLNPRDPSNDLCVTEL